MLKFSSKFTGCKAGEIYPTEFQIGDDCPPELEAAARAVGAVKDAKPVKKAADAK